jgi:hypothetical protein
MSSTKQTLTALGVSLFALWFLLAIVLPTIDRIVERLAVR